MVIGRAAAPGVLGSGESGGSRPRNSTRQVILASLVGTSIEFYDSLVSCLDALRIMRHGTS